MNDYPPDWLNIATEVKNEAKWLCVRCEHPNEWDTAHVLTVHHLDGDKANCEWWNIPALCQRCHLSIQGRVNMGQGWAMPHSGWFLPYVAGYYAFTVLGLKLSRAEVEANLVKYLAAGQPQLESFYAEYLR